MRGLLLIVLLMLAGAPVAAAAQPTYYVSLGDSLAAGAQFAEDGSPLLRPGYAQTVLRVARKSEPGLRLRSFACPGETTGTFMKGPCPYEGRASDRPQLERALSFMRAHKGQVALVTISLGSNDVNRCLRVARDKARACAAAGLKQLETELPGEFAALREAAGPDAQIAALTLYNLYLGYFFDPTRSPELVLRNSTALFRSVNATIAGAAERAGFVTADGFRAFRSGQVKRTTEYGGKQVPVAVATVCRLTQACLPRPQRNVHPTDRGYARLAAAFVSALGL